MLEGLARRCWLPVAPSLIGARDTLGYALGKELLLTRNGTAFHNQCPHRGAPFVPCDKASVVRCDYHGFVFRKSDGTLVGAPHTDKATAARLRDSMRLKEVPLHRADPFYYAWLGEDDEAPPPPQTAHALPMPGPFRSVMALSLPVESAWHVLVENFCCWYHVPQLHAPSGLGAMSLPEDHFVVEDARPHDGLWFGTNPLRDSGGHPATQACSDTAEGLRSMGLFVAATPNAFAFMMPSHVFTCIVEPVSDTRSIEHVELFVHEGMEQEKIVKLWDFYNDVNNEDIAMCEAITKQRGSDVPDPKRTEYVLPHEEVPRRFHERIAAAL